MMYVRMITGCIFNVEVSIYVFQVNRVFYVVVFDFILGEEEEKKGLSFFFSLPLIPSSKNEKWKFKSSLENLTRI